MKYTLSVSLILLLSMICGCSKPEPPVVKASPLQKKPVVKEHTLNVTSVTSKIHYAEAESRAMATVRVTDADTGLPITHATVCARWRSGDGPIISFGIHTEDGVYQVPTNRLIGRFYIGALADGYLPNQKGSPTFPVELSLKKGDSIKVAGTILHANGNPVTNGIINLRTIGYSLWAKHWRRLSPCSVIPDINGEFILPTVPAGIDEVYVKYDLPDNTTVEFIDKAFSTSDGDVYLTLQLPPELTIKGRVLFSSGAAVSGAWVWTERVTGESPDTWNKELAEKNHAVNSVTTLSDAEGNFELTLLKIMDRYIVKAYHPLYAAAHSGPYFDSEPPPDPLDLIIQEDGARLYGRLSVADGNPVTNCEVRYVVMKMTSPSVGHGMQNIINLDIDEDGNYISGIVPPGSYDMTFTPRGYFQQTKEVTIQKNATELCNVVFIPYCVITGIVYDAETRQPIPDVTLANITPQNGKDKKFSKITDQNGTFWVLSDNSYLNIEFKHPEYASIMYNFSNPSHLKYTSAEEIVKNIGTEVLLSKKGRIRVFGQKHDGTPLDGYGVKLVPEKPDKSSRGHYDYFGNYQRAELIDGEALLTNVPVIYSSVYAEICTKDYSRTLAKSDLVSITAGEEASVTVTLPPTGSLILSFIHPIEKDGLEIVGIQAGNGDFNSSYTRSFRTRDFTLKDQQMILNEVITNEYKVRIKGMSTLSLETNVLITVNNSTEIIIDNNTNTMGVIRGSVTTRGGGKIRCLVSLQEQDTGKQIKGASLFYDSIFSIGGLSTDRLYDLTVNFSASSMTNITIQNIAPNGPTIDIQLPDVYRITGNVIDGDGTPLKANIGIKSHTEYGPGEFTLYPVFPGTYSVCVNAKDYAPVEREVTVYDSNVDLGDIVLKTKTD